VQFCPTDGTGLTEQTDDDPRVGTLIDRYRLVERLGEGGMGIVYRAEHTVIGRPVALKLLHPNLIAMPEAADRFFREARAAGEVATEHNRGGHRLRPHRGRDQLPGDGAAVGLQPPGGFGAEGPP